MNECLEQIKADDRFTHCISLAVVSQMGRERERRKERKIETFFDTKARY